MSLYRGHTPTGVLGKVLIAADAGWRALTNPREARLVGVVGEATGHAALARIRARMRQSASGRTILHERPIINTSTLPLERLSALPSDTLGGAYASFLARHSFSPDERSDVQFVDDEELAYVMTRYRQVHDIWHVLYGLPPSFLGEVALKWLEAAQTGLPMCALGAAAGGLRLDAEKRALVTRHALPGAARHARSGVDLMSIYYEREMDRPLEALRDELGLEMPPAALLSAVSAAGRRKQDGGATTGTSATSSDEHMRSTDDAPVDDAASSRGPGPAASTSRDPRGHHSYRQ